MKIKNTINQIIKDQTITTNKILIHKSKKVYDNTGNGIRTRRYEDGISVY